MSISDAGRLDLNIQEEQHERNYSPTSTPPEEPNALQFQDQTNQEQDNEYEKNSSLTIQLPSSDTEFNNGDKGFEEDDEPTTPTSTDQKIPVITTCPPAPRKPKSVSIGNQRKTPNLKRISIDLMVKINAMFAPAEIVAVPDFLAGDLGRPKRVKTTDVITDS